MKLQLQSGTWHDVEVSSREKQNKTIHFDCNADAPAPSVQRRSSPWDTVNTILNVVLLKPAESAARPRRTFRAHAVVNDGLGADYEQRAASAVCRIGYGATGHTRLLPSASGIDFAQ